MDEEIGIVEFKGEYSEEIMRIWNECSLEGESFPWEWEFDLQAIKSILENQDYIGVANKNGKIIGFYILHRNNRGREGHISNALYAVDKKFRSKGCGYLLVMHSLSKAKELGYKAMQFNSVVKTNAHACNLYKKIGFQIVGEVPEAFHTKYDTFESVYIMHKKL
jgi:ribosomal protein S18 acetylase RimI-like enzyme